MKCLIPLFAAVACAYAHISSYPTAKHGPVGYHGPLAKPVVLKDGHIADTHEVAAARGAHFVAVAKAPQGHDGGHDGGYGGHDGGYGGGHEGGYGGGYGGGDGHGHFSYGPGTHDVYKGEHGYAGLHSVDHGQEHGHGHGDAGYDGGFAGGYGGGHGGDAGDHGSDGGHAVYGGYVYHGPLAAPVVLKSGYLADTHDVAAAKGAHLVALEKAHSHGGWGGDYHH